MLSNFGYCKFLIWIILHKYFYPFSLLFHFSRFSHLMITCVCESPARTTWNASQCCASIAQPPSSLRLPSCSAQSIPLPACGAGARWASRAITVRQKSTCATPTLAWMEECVPAEKEAIPASAVKTTPVSGKEREQIKTKKDRKTYLSRTRNGKKSNLKYFTFLFFSLSVVTSLIMSMLWSLPLY